MSCKLVFQIILSFNDYNHVLSVVGWTLIWSKYFNLYLIIDSFIIEMNVIVWVLSLLRDVVRYFLVSWVKFVSKFWVNHLIKLLSNSKLLMSILFSSSRVSIDRTCKKDGRGSRWQWCQQCDHTYQTVNWSCSWWEFSQAPGHQYLPKDQTTL